MATTIRTYQHSPNVSGDPSGTLRDTQAGEVDTGSAFAVSTTGWATGSCEVTITAQKDSEIESDHSSAVSLTVNAAGGTVPSYVASSTGSGGATTPSMTLPSGTQNGDLVIWAITADATNAAPYILFPAGWTKPSGAEVQTGGDGSVTTWAWRIIDGSEGSPINGSFQGGGNDNWSSVMRSYRGASGINVYTQGTTAGASSPWTAGNLSVTTTVDNCRLVYVMAIDNSTSQTSITFTDPSGFDTQTKAETSDWSHLATSHGSQATAGSTGNLAGGASGTGTGAVAQMLIAIAP